MGIGAAIFLIVLGAILAFAVEWDISWLNLQAAGFILMAAGVLWLVLFFRIWNRRRAERRAARIAARERYEADRRRQRTVVEETVVPRTVVEERHVQRGTYDDSQVPLETSGMPETVVDEGPERRERRRRVPRQR